MINFYFGIPQFNALFAPYISNASVGYLELLLSIMLFNIVLILRTSVIEYTNASPLPKWNRRLGQLGLYFQGMLSTIVFFDGYKAIFDVDAIADPRVFLVLFIISAICIKIPSLYRAYKTLVIHKKMFTDWQKGFFI